MNENELNEFLHDASISFNKRICDVIMLDILCSNSIKLNLHIECLFKVIKNNITLASSNDMFVPSSNVKRRKFRWDKPGMSLFDESIKKNEDIFNSRIEKISLEYNELTLRLYNGVTIKIIPDTVEEREAYIFFTKEKTYFAYLNP